jgi:hypothetical protein
MLAASAFNLVRRSRNPNKNEYHHEAPSAVKPQPKEIKRKGKFHHEGREEHEVKKLKCKSSQSFVSLRALRGGMIFSH